MITPSFGLTATERVLPRLALDFTTASLDSRITFTRSGDTATVVGSNGNIQTSTANTPRFDYNPTTLACKGLLIEEARTNIILHSQDFTNVTWVKEASAVITNVAATSPSGATTVDQYTVTNGSTGFNRVSYLAVTTSATAYSFSVYVKANGWNFVLLRTPLSGANSNVAFDLSSGTSTYAAAGFTAFITPFNNGWYRIGFSVTSGSVNGQVFMRFQPTATTDNTISQVLGDGVSGGYLYGAQLEAGAFATSYIPTEASALTRNADVATMTGTNFSDWFNATEGTLVLQNQYPDVPTGTGRGVLSLNTDATNFMQLYVRLGTVNAALSQVSGVTQWVNAGSTASTSPFKTAFAYKLNDIQMATNGANVFTDTVANIPTVNQLVFSSGNCGYIQKFNYYPMRLTSAEVIAFSKQ